jgi:hypothetical protein
LAEADRQSVDRALRLLATNPRDPRLRICELEGRERLACSYAYEGRILFTWAVHGSRRHGGNDLELASLREWRHTTGATALAVVSAAAFRRNR